MIVERLQHLVRSLNGLTDGTSKKLVFFRIGGVSSSSRIEYEVKGNMVEFNDHLKDVDTQIMRYLRGALDLEVVANKQGGKNAGVRMDLFMVIWKSMSNLTEDDAEQLFWGEPDVGIVRSASAGKRVQQSVRTPFSRFLLEYYSERPKPVQSLFVDHPEKDSESFYQQLLTLLAVGELECTMLSDELPGTTLSPEAEAELSEAVAIEEDQEPEEALPATTLAAEPEPGPVEGDSIQADLANDTDAEPALIGTIHEEVNEDDYIDSLINAKSLESRQNGRGRKGKVAGKNVHKQDSLKLLFKEGSMDTEGEREGPAPLEGNDLDLLGESLEVSELPERYLGQEQNDDGDVKQEELEELLSSFDDAFDAPLAVDKPTKSQQAKKIAGLRKMLKAAKKGF